MAGIWQCIQPVTSLIIGYLCGKEKLDNLRIGGIVLAVIGTGLISIFGENSSQSSSSSSSSSSVLLWWIGSLLFLGNTSCSVIYLMFGTHSALEQYSSMIVTAVCYMYASICMCLTLFILFLSTLFTDTLAQLVCADCAMDDSLFSLPHKWAYYALVYYIIFPSMIAYSLMTYASKHTDTSINVAYGAIQPMVAALLSQLLIWIGISPNCFDSESDFGSVCLNGIGFRHCAVILIVIGLWCLVQSEKRRNFGKNGNNSSTYFTAKTRERSNYELVSVHDEDHDFDSSISIIDQASNDKRDEDHDFDVI